MYLFIYLFFMRRGRSKRMLYNIMLMVVMLMIWNGNNLVIVVIC